MIFLGPFISSRGVTIILVLQKENLDRMKEADPFDIQLKDYLARLPALHARDLDIVIAYEEDSAGLLALSAGRDMKALIAYIERGRQHKPGDAEPPRRIP